MREEESTLLKTVLVALGRVLVPSIYTHMPKFEMQRDTAVLYATTQCFLWALLEYYKVKCIIDLPAKRKVLPMHVASAVLYPKL